MSSQMITATLQLMIRQEYLKAPFSLHYCSYICFINDLPEGISSGIELYIDDILLYSTITSPDD